MDLNDRKKLWLKSSSLLMVITLAWLTISTPFIYQAQENLIVSLSAEDLSGADKNEASNPIMPNPSEEKTGSSTNNFSEYLNHHEVLEYVSSLSNKYLQALSAKLYMAFHGELLTPPPNDMV